MSDSNVKSEPMETSIIDLESEILQLCLQFPNGISDKILENTFRHITAEQRLHAINHLLKLNKIDLLKSSDTFVYRLRDTLNISSNGITDQIEKIVYQVIKECENLGIWMREIRIKTQLSPTILNKTLKTLENKKIIKTVKSVHANKKKVYMLYELTPDASITGGTWYANNEFEEEFVRILNEQCARLLNERYEEAIKKFPRDIFLQRTNSYISSSELVSLINQMGIATVSLTIQDIESILNTLVYDGKIEKMTVTSTKSNENLYRSIKSIVDSTPIIRNPCGICPIFHDCHDEGLINPSTCIYLTKWLNF